MGAVRLGPSKWWLVAVVVVVVSAKRDVVANNMKLTKEKLQQIIKEELESISEDKEKNERAKRLSNYETLFKIVDVLRERGQLQDLMKLKDEAKEADKLPKAKNARFKALAVVQGKVEELIEDIIGSGGVKNVAAGITRNEGRLGFDDLGSLMKLKQEYEELKAQGYPEKKPESDAERISRIMGRLD